MSDMDFETQLRSIASGMEYPPTPGIAASVAVRLHPARPRLAYRILSRSLILALVFLVSLMVIPSVRAAVLEFIQIGVVQVFRSEPAPVPPLTQIPLTLVPVTATPVTTLPAPGSLPATRAPTVASMLPLLEQMAGETTLSGARQQADYPILLPSYPTDLGKPDRVFVVDANGPMTILVWMAPQDPDQVKMSLHFIPEGSWVVDKFAPQAIDETSVNGRSAIWAVGPYPILFRNGDMEISQLVNGHVLIWENGRVTYRLESNLSMDEAVKIAESLEPIP
jgi:hypothetical protein